MLDHSC